jgi:hypothetical protein
MYELERKFDKSITEIVEQAIAENETLGQAAVSIGLDKSTLSRWIGLFGWSVRVRTELVKEVE